MSVKCQNCGNVQPNGKFCPSCGGQMLPQDQPQVPPSPAAQGPQMPPTPAQQTAAAGMPTPPTPGGPGQFRPQQPGYPPQAPGQPGYPPQGPGQPYLAQPGYPTQPPQAKGGKGWILWASIAGGVVLLAGVAVAILLMRDKPATPPGNQPGVVNVDPGNGPATPTTPGNNYTPPKTTPAPSTASGKSLSGYQVKLVSQGALGVFPETMVSEGQYLGFADSQTAAFYKFDAKGKLNQLTKVDLKQDYGEMVSVTIGNLNNNGAMIMLALYEQKLLVIGEGGDYREMDTDGQLGILMGDYDGDGKTETIFLNALGDGTYGFEVYRYPADSWIYKKEGRKDAWPALFQTSIKAGKNNLLLGYAFEGDKFYLDLYKWDGVGGPGLIGSFEAENSDAAPPEWIASGPTALGPTLAVGRGGDKATIEVLTVASDAKSAKSLGVFTPDGKGSVAVNVGQFLGQGSQLLTVDETGNYYLYDIAK